MVKLLDTDVFLQQPLSYAKKLASHCSIQFLVNAKKFTSP